MNHDELCPTHAGPGQNCECNLIRLATERALSRCISSIAELTENGDSVRPADIMAILEYQAKTGNIPDLTSLTPKYVETCHMDRIKERIEEAYADGVNRGAHNLHRAVTKSTTYLPPAIKNHLDKALEEIRQTWLL